MNAFDACISPRVLFPMPVSRPRRGQRSAPVDGIEEGKGGCCVLMLERDGDTAFGLVSRVPRHVCQNAAAGEKHAFWTHRKIEQISGG